MKWLVLSLVLFFYACAPAPPLAVMGQIPPFQLTAQSGQTFDSQSLAGHVWVANFIYTTCPGPCPMMSHQMSEFQRNTANLPDVKLVSFTVDPAHDTPQVLAAYAKHFKADPKRWIFLTGDQSKLNALGHDDFKLNNVDGSLNHSTRFVLVDRQMRIRGYYRSTDDDFLARLERDLRQLEEERS
jgi:protein SCO1/2